MPLDKPTLQSALEVAFGRDQVSDATAKANIVSMADAIATAIDTFVKSGEVIVTSNGVTGSGPPGGPLPISGLNGTGNVI